MPWVLLAGTAQFGATVDRCQPARAQPDDTAKHGTPAVCSAPRAASRPQSTLGSPHGNSKCIAESGALVGSREGSWWSWGVGRRSMRGVRGGIVAGGVAASTVPRAPAPSIWPSARLLWVDARSTARGRHRVTHDLCPSALCRSVPKVGKRGSLQHWCCSFLRLSITTVGRRVAQHSLA